MKEVYVKTRAEWRKRLSKQGNNEPAGIWLRFYQKGSKQPSLAYEEAVEEALCFGWIDSIIKKKDATSYVRKFTPRKPNSVWSATNKRRVAKLTLEKRMTAKGLALVKQAKTTGQWDNDPRPDIDWNVPPELTEAFRAKPKAKAFFEELAPTYQKQYIGWVQSAKRSETRAKRVKESVALLSKGQKLGLK